MAVTGLGVDLTRISRFRTFLDEGKLAVLERLFTLGERTYAMTKSDPAPHLAARFAAKEAFLKALGLGLRKGIRWQEMEIESDSLGKPTLMISGRAQALAEAAGVSRVHLSYSHDGDYAFATVILEEL